MIDWGNEVHPRSRHSGRVGIDRLLKDARRGDLEAVRAHLRRDPSLLNAKSGGHNRTFLWEATRGNRAELVGSLIEAGADPNLPGRVRSEIPVLLKPYCIARRYRRVRLAQTLLDAGTTLDLYSSVYLGDIESTERILERDPSRIAEEQAEDTVWRVTPLHYAVAGGHVRLVRYLIERGARVGPYTRLLCDIAVRTGQTSLLPVLREAGADPDLMKVWGC